MKSPVVRRIVVHEVVVPARIGAINSAEKNKPLHKLASRGRAGWTKQFDELPKAVLELETDTDIVGLGECYRDHDRATVQVIGEALLGRSLYELHQRSLPMAHSREYDGFGAREGSGRGLVRPSHDGRPADLNR